MRPTTDPNILLNNAYEALCQAQHAIMQANQSPTSLTEAHLAVELLVQIIGNAIQALPLAFTERYPQLAKLYTWKQQLCGSKVRTTTVEAQNRIGAAHIYALDQAIANTPFLTQVNIQLQELRKAIESTRIVKPRDSVTLKLASDALDVVVSPYRAPKNYTVGASFLRHLLQLIETYNRLPIEESSFGKLRLIEMMGNCLNGYRQYCDLAHLEATNKFAQTYINIRNMLAHADSLSDLVSIAPSLTNKIHHENAELLPWLSAELATLRNQGILAPIEEVDQEIEESASVDSPLPAAPATKVLTTKPASKPKAKAAKHRQASPLKQPIKHEASEQEFERKFAAIKEQERDVRRELLNLLSNFQKAQFSTPKFRSKLVSLIKELLEANELDLNIPYTMNIINNQPTAKGDFQITLSHTEWPIAFCLKSYSPRATGEIQIFPVALAMAVQYGEDLLQTMLASRANINIYAFTVSGYQLPLWQEICVHAIHNSPQVERIPQKLLPLLYAGGADFSLAGSDGQTPLQRFARFPTIVAALASYPNWKFCTVEQCFVYNKDEDKTLFLELGNSLTVALAADLIGSTTLADKSLPCVATTAILQRLEQEFINKNMSWFDLQSIVREAKAGYLILARAQNQHIDDFATRGTQARQFLLNSFGALQLCDEWLIKFATTHSPTPDFAPLATELPAVDLVQPARPSCMPTSVIYCLAAGVALLGVGSMLMN